MTPKQFVLLAIAAAVSSLLALTSFALNDNWSEGKLVGTRLFPGLAADGARIATLQVSQDAGSLTFERKGEAWGVKERAGYPVDADKIRSLIVRLSQAELMEPKTRKADRYQLIELEDPAGKSAKSRLVRALDGKGATLAEVVVGKRRSDVFGAGKSGTYVRKPGDPQTWLASGELAAPLEVREWLKPQVLELDSAKISKLSVEIEGEEPLVVERGSDKDAKVAFVGLPPQGKKLKDEYAADSLLRAAANIELDDVRKLPAGATDKRSKVSFQTSDGLKVAYALVKAEDANYWLTITVGGDGEAKKQADELAARLHGWDFKVSPGKAESLLKRRTGLLDDKPS